MTKLFLPLLFSVSLLAACVEEDETAVVDEQASAQATNTPGENNPVDSTNFTTMKWDEMVRNMGTIMEGQKLEVSFKFTNTGNKPLIIEKAVPSCGCTVPEKPEKPIMPGEQGIIKAVFNSDGRSGTNHKTINVVANTSGGTNHQLEFNVDVKAKGTTAATPTF